jgi:beta-galactosidase
VRSRRRAGARSILLAVIERLPHVAYGGDYNPEQWPEDVWAQDVRLMRAAGVNLVTVAVFAWSRLEPAPGAYDLAWLDRVMDLLHDGGIAVDLATATASPPPWLAHRHPETLPELADGTRLWPGGRQHYCPSSPVYRAAALRLVTVLAGRYASHPGLALWHVNNEYGCHVPACWCDVSAAAFRDWLRRRYGTLDALNDAWATAFWSQRYASWEEVLPPRRAPTFTNPTQQLDFRRFSSDALLECFEMERAILAELSPGVPVTTNFQGFFEPLDYWRWAAAEDVVSNDSYPDPGDPLASARAAMAGDLMRSLGGGRPWLLMEQSPNRVNWRARNAAKAPGQMRLWSYQAIARGADGVLFFQWRQSRAGAEKWHSAMVPHGPVDRSPTWREVVGLGAELRRLDAVVGTRVRADAALLLDWESWWALELPSKPSADVRMLERVEACYEPLFRANVAVDFAAPAADLSRYRLLVAPNLYLVSDEAAANLRRFVERGGVLVVSFFSGLVDASDHVRLGGYPGAFGELLGLRVEDFEPLAENRRIGIRFADGGEGWGRVWSEQVEPLGAEVVAAFTGGGPAVLRHRAGAGTAWYVATALEPDAMERVLRRAWTEAGVSPVAEAPDGVEAVRREDGDRRLLFLLNHGSRAVEVPVPSGAMELVAGRVLEADRLRLEPRGVAIVRDTRPA